MVGSGSWTWQLPGVAPGSGADGLSRGWVPWRRWRGDGVPVAAVRARVVLACGWLAGGGQGADRGEDVREQVRAGGQAHDQLPAVVDQAGGGEDERPAQGGDHRLAAADTVPFSQLSPSCTPAPSAWPTTGGANGNHRSSTRPRW